MITDQYIDYLVQVLRCAVTEKHAPDIPDDIDAEEFIRFCRYHKVDNIVYLAIGSRISGELRSGLDDTYNQMLMIQASQQYYLEEIENSFENSGIDHLVLKGRELAKLYPSEDMRQSSDIDIYIGRNNAIKAKQIMLDMGFDIEVYSDSNDDHDEYLIDKYVMCELHRVLIQDAHPWREECNRIPDRLILCEGTKHSFRMSPEDFYVYNLAHTAKHMKLSGIGIRVFLDQWLIYEKYKDVFDYEYLEQTLKQANLYEFDKNARELYEYWFDGITPKHPETVRKMALYVAESGWVGTSRQFLATGLAEKAGKTGTKMTVKLDEYRKLIFIPYSSMVYRYKILEKHKWLLPFCHIHRLIKSLFVRRDVIKGVTEKIDNADMDYGKQLLSFKESIGL